MKNFAIFLDIDGVLNGMSTYQMSEIDTWINDRYLDNLVKLVEYYKADIILSSSWLSFFKDDLTPCTRLGKLLHDRLSQKGLVITDLVCPVSEAYNSKSRSEKIAEYLEKNPYTDYLILDDEQNWSDDQKSHWIQTFAGEYDPTNEFVEGLNDEKLKDALAYAKN